MGSSVGGKSPPARGIEADGCRRNVCLEWLTSISTPWEKKNPGMWGEKKGGGGKRKNFKKTLSGTARCNETFLPNRASGEP